MKIKEILYDYFSFNRAEQRGLAVLLLILAVIIMTRILLPENIPFTETENEEFSREIEKFELEMARANQHKPVTYNRYPGIQKGPVVRIDTSKPLGQRPRTGFTIELNGADTMELQRLKGIGPAFARRIVAYRDRLGGFCRKDQLLEVYGMDPARYEGIRDNIILDTSKIKKIDMNKVLFKELLRHPYFPYELTREIFIYRKKVKRFQSVEQLKEIEGITDSVYMKILTYVNITS